MYIAKQYLFKQPDSLTDLSNYKKIRKFNKNKHDEENDEISDH